MNLLKGIFIAVGVCLLNQGPGAASTIQEVTNAITTGIKCVNYKHECDFEKGNCDRKIITCDNMCFLLVKYNEFSNYSKLEISYQGCWDNDKSCRAECEFVKPLKNNVGFCCCTKDMCNANATTNGLNFTKDTLTTESSTFVEEHQTEKDRQLTNTLLYSIVPIAVTVIIVVSVFIIWRFYLRENRYMGHSPLSSTDPEFNKPPSPMALRNIELIEPRARGRFADVWKGRMGDFVAVKIMSIKEKAAWQTEKDIYKLPQMEHENVLRFIGAERRDQELWLISEYHENGSLCDYLKSHTITWSELCKIGESMSCGLAYLHSEIPGIDCKPSIAHRDFKSKNVLLKHDLTACIADFGLAIFFEPGKSLGETHGLNMSEGPVLLEYTANLGMPLLAANINDKVGTRRYMAPEVLEGAISFNRDAFLRIDMYACGLVIWELMSRCSDVDAPVDEYQFPYEEEIGGHPTQEDLQNIVVMKKIRPSIKEHWLTHSGLEALVPTIEECWDQDAEARISAECVHERFLKIEGNMNVTQNNQVNIVNTNNNNNNISNIIMT